MVVCMMVMVAVMSNVCAVGRVVVVGVVVVEGVEGMVIIMTVVVMVVSFVRWPLSEGVRVVGGRQEVSVNVQVRVSVV